MNKFINFRLISILLFAVVITACGGGDGGGNIPPAPEAEPAVWDNTNWDNMEWQ